MSSKRLNLYSESLTYRVPAGASPDSHAKRERKRAQNRLNQRAFRLRKKKFKNSKDKPYLYTIHRWQVAKTDDKTHLVKDRTALQTGQKDFSCSSPVRVESSRSVQKVGKSTVDSESATLWYKFEPYSTNYSFPSDHLLHLIQYNVCRGFASIKAVISQQFDVNCKRSRVVMVKPSAMNIAAAFATMALPDSIIPTPLQLNIAHPPWIDVFPFPRMRDNLIKREGRFDQSDFCNDILGTLIDGSFLAKGDGSPNPNALNKWALKGVDEDELTANRNGLIVWGEPYDGGSWEATPAFLMKWAWVVEGCDELINSTNYWRMVRGEERLFPYVPT